MNTLFTFIVIGILGLTQAFGNTHRDSVKTLEETNITLRRWYFPHYIPLQYAGNIGFISAGIGYGARNDGYQLSLLYGYTPASLAGVRIHTLTAKNIFHIHRFYLSKKRTLIPYAALGVSVEVGGRSFFTTPSNMPEDYYNFPKSIHLIPAGGVKLRYMTERLPSFRGIEFFAELTTVDAYIWYKVISDEVKVNDILSVAFGVNLLKK